MRNSIKLTLTTVLISAVLMPVSILGQKDAKQAKPALMVLGSYHMGNPGRDIGNVQADDVRTEKRQKEMAEFAAVLKKFRPTKIALELPPSRAAYLDNYQAYRDGKFALTANEVDQLGFRLAKDLNHSRVYTIDWQGKFDFDRVLASARTNNQASLAESFMATGKQEAGRQTELLKTSTISEMFRYLNDDTRMDEWHTYYMSLLRIGAKDEYAGADLVGGWYERNLKIYSNIARLAESNDDRILVIIGAGHTKLLRQFVTEAGEFEQHKLDRYL
jgi:hypothetical protein